VSPIPLRSPAAAAEGLRRRDEALALLAARRAAVVRAGQRALLAALLERDEATADDVRDAVPLSSAHAHPRRRYRPGRRFPQRLTHRDPRNPAAWLGAAHP
jgi:hypothetical protein